MNTVQQYVDRYFATLQANYQRDQDAIAEYEAEKERLATKYINEGDIYSASGIVKDGEFHLNYAWKLLKVGLHAEAIKKLEEIMGEAADKWAEEEINRKHESDDEPDGRFVDLH